MNIVVNNETNLPLISVITVGLNSEEYIEQCIKSVVSQNFDNFEYIVIDGGSEDNSIDIIKKYDDKISYWHSKKDRGLAHAFNEGVINSKGKWLIYLNSDDYFKDEYTLATMAPILLDNPEVDVLFGQVTIVSREKKPDYVGGPYGKEFKWSQFLWQDTIPHQAAFTNRYFFDEVGLFSEKFKIAVDYEHFLRTGNNIKAMFVPVLVSYMRDGGVSQQKIGETIAELHKARLNNDVLHPLIAFFIYYYICTKVNIGHYIKKFFNKRNKMQ